MKRLTHLLVGMYFLIAGVLPVMSHEPPAGANMATEAVSILGAVKHTMVLRVDDLKSFPTENGGHTTLVCQSGRTINELDSITGVLLRDILSKAIIVAPAHNDVKKMIIIASASDGYKVVFSWSEIFNSPVGDGVIVFYESQGKPLGDDVGKIALVSTKDIKTGPRRVKWLKEIEVRKIVD